MDYFNLMEERRASNADKEDASNRAAAFLAWAAELQSIAEPTSNTAKSAEGTAGGSPTTTAKDSPRAVPLPRTLFEVQLGTGDLCSGGRVFWDNNHSEPDSDDAVIGKHHDTAAKTNALFQSGPRRLKRNFAAAACSLDGQLTFLHLRTARASAPPEDASANGFARVQSAIVCTADLGELLPGGQLRNVTTSGGWKRSSARSVNVRALHAAVGTPVNTCVIGNCAGFAPVLVNEVPEHAAAVSRESSQSHSSTRSVIPTAEFADAATDGFTELPHTDTPTALNATSTAGTVVDAPTLTFDNHFGVDGVPDVQFSTAAGSDNASARTPSTSSSSTKSQKIRMTEEPLPPSPERDQSPEGVLVARRHARVGNIPCCVFTDPYGQLVAQVGFAVEAGLQQVREWNESGQDASSSSPTTGRQAVLVEALEVEDGGRLLKAAQDATSVLLMFAGGVKPPMQCPNIGMRTLHEVLLGVDEAALESWVDELQCKLETL